MAKSAMATAMMKSLASFIRIRPKVKSGFQN
jgi:hypothetical protein